MKVLGKPQNNWGWVRAAGLVVFTGVVVWTVLAAGLRGVGEVSWMAWSGYQNFWLLDAIELAVVPLLAALIGGWLEEQDLNTETEQSRRREAEQAVAQQRKNILKRFHDALLSELPDAAHGAAEITEPARLKILEITRSVLAELDGKGKGEVLHFFYEKGLLVGEKPPVELTGIDFEGVRIHEARLNGICLERVNLTSARLEEAHLARARLSGANLSRAFLRRADLRDAVLAGSNLSGAHLESANLEGADLQAANLEGAFLTNANLKRCLLNGIQVKDAHFTKADFNGSQGISPQTLDQAVLIETIFPDGRKVTNEKGKAYLKDQEIAMVIDRL